MGKHMQNPLKNIKCTKLQSPFRRTGPSVKKNRVYNKLSHTSPTHTHTHPHPHPHTHTHTTHQHTLTHTLTTLNWSHQNYQPAPVYTNLTSTHQLDQATPTTKSWAVGLADDLGKTVEVNPRPRAVRVGSRGAAGIQPEEPSQMEGSG